jgi:uncharacterized protein YaeQ
MALGSTMYTADVTLADMDRGVYETLNVRLARHPAESLEYLASRLLAYCMEYEEGITFGKGLAEADEPALLVRDDTGQLKVWIDVGAPDADRLHKASKSAERVAVYTHRDPAMLQRNYAGKRIHQAKEIALYAIDRSLLDALTEHIDRRTAVALTITEGLVYLDIAGVNVQGSVVRHSIG